ncbi:MAG: hypothetical protein QM811_02270 [Pirellulales bacterium]
MPADVAPDVQQATAAADPRVAELLTGKTIVKTVSILGKLVNFVIK